MNDLDDKIMKNHEYDGIYELDNDLPFWWVALFIFTVIIGVTYLAYYGLEMGPDQEGEYAAEVKRFESEKEIRLRAERYAAEAKLLAAAEAGEVVEETADTGPMEISPESIARGKKIFTGQICHTCHKMDGGGLVGPNLTDSHFIHGDKVEDMVRIIAEGNLAKGMTPWKGILSDKQIFDVASYVHSIKGTNAPGGKAP